MCREATALCISEHKKGADSYVIETLRKAFLLSEVSHELSRATPEAERERVSRHMNRHLFVRQCAIWACPQPAPCNLGLSPTCTLVQVVLDAVLGRKLGPGEFVDGVIKKGHVILVGGLVDGVAPLHEEVATAVLQGNVD